MGSQGSQGSLGTPRDNINIPPGVFMIHPIDDDNDDGGGDDEL